jgi:hypothetical protein
MARPRSALRVTALAVGVVVASLSLAPIAAAATRHTDDATGDVWELLRDKEGQQIGWGQAGSPDNADVIATDARHGKRQIVFTVHFAELERGPHDDPFITQERMVFDHGPGVTAEVYTTSGWDGRSFLFCLVTGNRVACPDLRHKIDYSADTVKVWVPRSCVHRPRWVRYSVAHATLGGGNTTTLEDDHDYFDNGLNSTHDRRVDDANLSARLPRC